MKPQYKKNPVLSYLIRRNFNATTSNHRESLSLRMEILIFSGKLLT